MVFTIDAALLTGVLTFGIRIPRVRSLTSLTKSWLAALHLQVSQCFSEMESVVRAQRLVWSPVALLPALKDVQDVGRKLLPATEP